MIRVLRVCTQLEQSVLLLAACGPRGPDGGERVFIELHDVFKLNPIKRNGIGQR